jgi:hypothetical protein
LLIEIVDTAKKAELLSPMSPTLDEMIGEGLC